MSTIARRFEELAREGRKGFIPFVTAGDPDLDTSLAVVLKLAALGADVIELGVPFSDPMADGPTIQRSSQRALAGGVTLANVMTLAEKVRAETDVPIVLFSYLNPLLQYGITKLGRAAAEVGIDGILITDAVDKEADEYSDAFLAHDVDLISLVAPTTTEKRLRRIAANSRGFIYAVSRAGVTGAREEMSQDAAKLVYRVRQYTSIPVAVGFGISTRDQVLDVWRYADAAVVGSAIVAEIEKFAKGDCVAAVERFVRDLLPQFAKSRV